LSSQTSPAQRRVALSQEEISLAGGHDLPEVECRSQLARILESADFEATARGHKFLSYVVDEQLSGRGDRIKAYSIAVEVFGRDASFDPQTDPIVRIEAGHLRRSLERYYLTSGQSDPILITIPKGGYVPTFTPRNDGVDAAVLTAPVAKDAALETGAFSLPRFKATWLIVVLSALLGAIGVVGWQVMTAGVGPAVPEVPRLLVEPFADLTEAGSGAAIATGLSQEIVGQLSKFKDLIVLESTEKSAPPPRFVLAGSVNLANEKFRLLVRLTNLKDGSVLWAQSYDGGMNVGQLLDAQADIARNVATSLAQTYGVIYQADASVRMVDAPEDWAAYSCTLSYYAYRVTLDAKVRPQVRACLEKAVARFPNYATAWALLSQTYMDEIRFSYPFDPNHSSTSVEKALAAARKAVELDPLNIRGLQAEMFALYHSNEVDKALAIGKSAYEINPNDTELMGEYGYRLAVSGNWAEGCPLVTEAHDRNPGPFAYYETALALCAYFAGDYAKAVRWIRSVPFASNAIYHAIAGAIFAEAGLQSEAERESDWLKSNAPALVKNIRQEAAERLKNPADVERILASLAQAGLNVPFEPQAPN
jgi:TolB-like protein